MTCGQCGGAHDAGVTHCPRTGDPVGSGPCGTQIDRYVVETLLGTGGMGAVYRARHALLDQPVALKLLRRDLAAAKDVLARFQREARAAATIGHPHIIRVTDVGTTESGQPFLVMELLEGRDLESLLHERGRLPLARVVDIATQALDGLAAAHAHGIVHRDFKPANVFLARAAAIDGSPRDFVKLLDFGISKFSGTELAPLTRTGMVMGTPQYMAPEQFMGAREVDARADLYAMGVTLYQMLTGTTPYDAQSYERLVVQVCTQPPKPLRSVAPDVSVELTAVVERAMAREPAARFSSAEELSRALREVANVAPFAPIAMSSSTSLPPAPLRAAEPLPRPFPTPPQSAVAAPPFAADGRASRKTPSLGGYDAPPPTFPSAPPALASAPQPAAFASQRGDTTYQVDREPRSGLSLGALMVFVAVVFAALALVGAVGVAAWVMSRPPQTVVVAATPSPVASERAAAAFLAPQSPLPAFAPSAPPPRPAPAAPHEAHPTEPAVAPPSSVHEGEPVPSHRTLAAVDFVRIHPINAHPFLPVDRVRTALARATPALAHCGRLGHGDHVEVRVIVFPDGRLFGANASSDDPALEDFADCVADAVESVGTVPNGDGNVNQVVQIDIRFTWR